ncbi:MAG: hypothetical protein ACI9EZ_001739 [Halobacteriales archaeon]|jgi:hypothetical protein
MSVQVDSSESELLACPNCGNGSFSWIIHQVQFGIVHRFANCEIDAEATKNGPITDSDIGENEVFCVNCQEFRTYDELVPVDAGDDIETEAR